MPVTSSFTLRASALAFVALTFGCTTRAAPYDGGALRDAAREDFDAAHVELTPVGYAQVRLVNLIPASPNLVVCLSTIAGTGLTETEGHILGAPDARLMTDGTLPYPGISPYLPLPLYDTPGLTYVIRLYSREEVPFVMLGICPRPGSIAPVIEARVEASAVTVGTLYSAVAFGVLPGTPVSCGASACPPPAVRLFPDDLTPPSGIRARVRLFQGIPNLPAPIHVCVDLDFQIVGGVVMDGPFPPIRALPPVADTDGVAFGEMSGFVDSPVLSTSGAFFVHAQIAGLPDCDPATLILGPIPVPLPVPDTAPTEVARTIDRGDVITNFAFGRVGAICVTNADCAATAGMCNTARHVCEDVLSPNLLPWQDVQGGLMPDAGVRDAGASDAGVDAG